MSVRAVLIGAAVALAIAAFGYINDSVLALPALVGGHLPVALFGGFLLLVLLLQPILRKASLKPREWATVLIMSMAACAVPGSGLMRLFSPVLALPMHYNEQRVGWQRLRALQAVPPELLANNGKYDDRVIGQFLSGAPNGQQIGLDEVPWAAWAGPIRSWIPIVLLLATAVLSLALILHYQWSRREQLPYPIAELAGTLIEGTGPGGLSGVFRHRGFWIAAIVVCLCESLHLWHVWNPNVIDFPMVLDFSAIAKKWPSLKSTPYAWGLFYVTIMPIAIGFGYMLSRDVSFSVGISQWVATLLWTALLSTGISFQHDRLTGGLLVYQHFGAYLAMGLFLLYTGRQFYLSVLRGGLLGRRRAGDAETPAPAIWAVRIGLVATIGTIAWLIQIGLAWPFAILLVGLFLLMYVVLSRISVETGLYILSGAWTPLAILLAVFGPQAMGPTAIAIICLFSLLLTMDPHESLMPFAVNALHLADREKIRPARAGASLWGVYAGAVAVALVVSLWANYHFGMPRWSSHAFRTTPQATFHLLSKELGSMEILGTREASEGYTGLERLGAMQPRKEFLIAGGVGFLLVASFSVLRLRFPRWPFHPVMFLVWCTWGLQSMWAGFLLGWAIHTIVIRLFGFPAYRKVRPVMIGLIAGDLFARVAFMAMGAYHYARTGERLASLWE